MNRRVFLSFCPPVQYTATELATYRDDPEALFKYRNLLMQELNSSHGVLQKGNPEQTAAREAFEANMKKKLEKKPEIFESIKAS